MRSVFNKLSEKLGVKKGLLLWFAESEDTTGCQGREITE